MHNQTNCPDLVFRATVKESDGGAVRAIVRSSGFFSPQEIDIAEELVLERLRQGEASGYHFLFAEERDEMLGYACYGEIPCTAGSYDLYWIVVAAQRRGHGIGGELLARTEASIRARDGRALFVDTSGRPQYKPTRRFYRAHRYVPVARVPEFYAPGDDKIVYMKKF